MLLLLLAFFAGILTVFAPCIFTLLPIIIGGSVSDTKDKLRPYIVISSLIVSLVVFTLLLKGSTVLIGVDPKFWVYVSGGLVIILGVLNLFPGVWEQIVGRLGWQAKSQEALGAGYRNKGRYAGPIITGAALGPVFSSCSPTYAFVLATILPANFALGLLYIVAYVAGLALVLLAIAVYGQKFISKFKWAANPHSTFRRGLGVLFIVVGLSIIMGWDKDFQTWFISQGPDYIIQFEQKLIEDQNSVQ